MIWTKISLFQSRFTKVNMMPNFVSCKIAGQQNNFFFCPLVTNGYNFDMLSLKSRLNSTITSSY